MKSVIHKLKYPCRNSLYIMREDLLPFSFGGNKVRIALEFFRDMKAKGRGCIIGYGSARSNLVRAIANLAGMFLPEGRVHIVSPSEADGSRPHTFNRTIAGICGAKFTYCTRENVAETVEGVMRRCEAEGLKPYYVNGDKYGRGNEAVPVCAYYRAYHEIAGWQEETGIKFQHIFLPVGTGMTIAGLIAGKHELCGEENITGISIARPELSAVESACRYLAAFGEINVDELDITGKYLRGGYGLYDEEVLNTIKIMLRLNGIPLDPTYTGKAFTGMCSYIEEHDISGKNILFIHTGGTPLFFDSIIDIT
ncbi:MAG: pyridoxal-phosphate dependent enzyme [Synergistaceae bacterium]|nr:pyridoxal-phosphate dependent enzyme [Synergistaceae bacterium]